MLVAVAHLWRPSLLETAENRLYDLVLGAVHSPQGSGVPVVVDIDEASLREFGQWPWPRYRLAWLLEAMRDAGALAVGVDLLFPEPDRTSVRLLKEELRRDRNLELGLPPLTAEERDNDLVLAATLAKGPYVMGYKFLFEAGAGPAPEDCGKPLNFVLVKAGGEPDGSSFFRAFDQVCNIPVLSKASAAAGFLNAAPDADGVLRRAPALIEREGMLYPSLALATVMEADGRRQATLRIGVGGDALRFGERTVPLGERGTLMIHFRGGRHDFPYFSAGDILSRRLDPEALRGKIAFLGSSAAGLEDLRATPLSPAFPGVEIHATLADNILRGDALRRPPWASGLELFSLLALGIGSSFLFRRVSALAGMACAAAGIVVLAGAAALLLGKWGVWVSPLFPTLAMVGVFSASNLVRLREKELEVQRRRDELALMQKAAIRSLAALSETRDPDSGRHIVRTQKYVRLLAERLKHHPRFRDHLKRISIEDFSEMVALHDIGKVGVPDHILLKPGKLSPPEFEAMKRHTVLGSEALRAAQRDLGAGETFFEPARKLVHSHHEKWDGTGYPEGLKGEEIPVEGRIMAVADVYDALISRRVYKPPFTHESALEIMKEGRGRHFDPAVLDAFLELEEEFLRIVRDFPDEDE